MQLIFQLCHKTGKNTLPKTPFVCPFKTVQTKSLKASNTF